MKTKDKTEKVKRKRPERETLIPEAEDKQVDDKLQEKEITYGKLLESIQDGVYAMDVEGRIIYVNEAGVKRTELPREFLIGKNFQLLIGEKYKDLIQRNSNARIKGHVIPPYEIFYDTPSGKVLWEEISTKTLYDEERVVGTIAITRDVTERKRVESDLREGEQRFRSLFERHDAVMLLIERETGVIVDANEAAAQFYGYSLNQLREMNMSDINQFLPRELAEEHQRAELEGRSYFIFPHRIASGEVRTVEVHSSTIEEQGRKLYFAVVHDITKRRQAEEALSHYHEHLEELVKERTVDLEMMNGQLITEVIQRKEAEKTQEELISKLQNALSRIKALSGLLPICSACKKIRNDAGYWEQMETYIRDHSEADFSHGICPECVERLYPEYKDK